MTQWIGGMGVIALVVAVLPRLAGEVRQLFFAEAPGPTEEKLAPQIRKTAASLWRLYAGLTAAEVIALGLAGMPWFDAVCHAMTTLAAGGFSPHAQSIMGYDSALIEWIICLFMFLAGANFALQYRALLGRPGALFRDDEFRAYAGIVALAAGLAGPAAVDRRERQRAPAARDVSGAVDPDHHRVRHDPTSSCGTTAPSWCCWP